MPRPKAPRYMYLQVEGEDVTWSNERRSETDVEYIQSEPTIREIANILKDKMAEDSCAACGQSVALLCEDCRDG